MKETPGRSFTTKRLRFMTRRDLSDEQRKILTGAAQTTFLAMESIGEQGELDCSHIRNIDDVRNGYTQFFDGDVLVAKITPCFENGKGALVHGTLNGIGFGTTELHVLRPTAKIDGRFLYYSTASDYFRKRGEATMFGSAGQKRVPGDFIRNFRVSVPQLEQQRVIADYLDRETVQIDKLVAAKERVLALLAEKRRAFIARAVTKEFDSTEHPASSESSIFPEERRQTVSEKNGKGDRAPSVESDRVKENPEIAFPTKRLRFMTRRDLSDEQRQMLTRAAQTTFLAMGSIGEQGELDCSHIRDIDGVRNGYTQFFDGDVLVAKITPCFENGKGALVYGTLNGIGFGTTELHVLRPTAEIDGRFLYYSTASDYFRKRGEATMFGSAGQKRVPEDFIRNFRVSVPQLEQQRAIADYLDRETARLDALAAAIKGTISLLKERRASLIAAAVTGQIVVGSGS